MSNQQTSNDEIDLMRLVRSLKKGFHSLLISSYHFIQFLLRNWIVITILFIVGVGLGYWKDANAEIGKESNLILKVNMSDASYLYDAVEKLNKKISDNDTMFLKKNGLYDETSLLKKVELKPIVKFDQIAQQYRSTDVRSLGLFFENMDEENASFDNEILFRSKIQRAFINLSESATQGSVDNFITYLNNNPLLKKVHVNYIESIASRIRKNEEMITQIDAVIDKMASRETGLSEINLNVESSAVELFDKKDRFNRDLYNAKAELLTNKDIIVVLNNIEIYNQETGILSKKKLIYPMLFVFTFIIFIGLIKVYRYMNKLAK